MSLILPIAIPPGETIKDSLEYHHMNQKELALRLGISEKHLVDIISGKVPVNPEIAQKLEKIIGGSAQFWLNLENSYQLSKLRIKECQKKEEQIEFAKKFTCYKEMAEAGFVKITTNWEEKRNELLKFFKLPDFENIYSLFPEVSFRNSENAMAKESIVSWLQCGNILAEKISLEKYNKRKLESLIPIFKKLTSCPHGFEVELQRICANVGLAIVFVPYFKNTKINGATRWIRKNKHPLIQMNMKGASSDIFWFTFFHELGHVLKHGGKKTNYFLESPDMVAIDKEKEEEADLFAEETLIPRLEFEEFSKSFKTNKNSKDIEEISKKWHIDPSITRGRLAKKGIIQYSQFREYYKKLSII